MWWISVGLVVMLLILLGTRLCVFITLDLSANQQLLKGKVTAMGIHLYKKSTKLEALTEVGHSFQIEECMDALTHKHNGSIPQLLGALTQFLHLSFTTLGRVKVSKFEWKTVIGLNEADQVGMISGALNAFKYTLVGSLSHFIRFHDRPVLTVYPRYEHVCFSTHFECVFSITIGQALYCMYLALRYR